MVCHTEAGYAVMRPEEVAAEVDRAEARLRQITGEQS